MSVWQPAQEEEKPGRDPRGQVGADVPVAQSKKPCLGFMPPEKGGKLSP